MVSTSVIPSYAGYNYGISLEGRQPGGGVDLFQVVRDKVLADIQFLQVLMGDYSPGLEVEICLSLIRPTIREIEAKIEYAQDLHNENYPNRKLVKRGDHFSSLSESDQYFQDEVAKDAQFIVLVWQYVVDHIFPELKTESIQEVTKAKNLHKDIELANQILKSGVIFSQGRPTSE